MKKLLVAALLGTVLLFLWNLISWTVLPLHNMTINDLPTPVINPEVMQETMPSPGVYHFPGFMSGAPMDTVSRAYQEGPVISILNYQPGDVQVLDPVQFVWSFILNYITVFLTFLLLFWSRIPDFWQRVAFCTIIGLIGGIAGHGALGLWFGFPPFYTFVNVLDLFVGWFIIGLAGARMIR
jgi:hypothetical protein